MDLNRIADVETLRDLLRVQLKESERLKRELQEAYKQLRDKDESKAEQLALRLAKVERQHASALRLLFGQKSERRNRGKLAKEPKRQKGHGPREQTLPVQLVMHQMDKVEVRCQLCSKALVAWKDQYEESEEIDFIPPKLIMKRHLRQKYRCTCGGCIEVAPGPVKLFPKARYSVNFALHVALQKYCYHLPLARQVRVF